MEEFTMRKLDCYVVGIKNEVVGDAGSRTDVAAMFYR